MTFYKGHTGRLCKSCGNIYVPKNNRQKRLNKCKKCGENDTSKILGEIFGEK